MPDRITIEIFRPEVAIEYHLESQEAGPVDRLAASELALHALAQQILMQRTALGLPCPTVITCLVESNIWQNGM